MIKQTASEQEFSVAIIGAGFAGLGMAIRLKQAGIEDFVILERATAIGGTWRDNQYPGAACDIPSNLYSYSFAPNPDWSRSYSGSAEILEYIHGLMRDFDLEAHIRFGREVSGLRFDAAQGQWHITCSGSADCRARAVVMAQGPLSNVGLPDMPGIDSYEGAKIHSARWDHDYDFRGKKVAVIGTGASAVQIIPELVKTVDQLTVFQRTPGWVMPRLDVTTPGWNKSLFRRRPRAQAAARNGLFWAHEAMAGALIWNTPMTRVAESIARRHLRRQVKDRWMRRQLTPNFTIGCKRVLMSNDYYPALQAPNCKLITWPIDRLCAGGIRTAEGIEHRFDAIVFATGFEVNKKGAPFPVEGLDGHTLDADWQSGAQAFKSVNVAHYPNLFLTFGPNSGPGHNSALVYMESQLDYSLQGIQRILDEDLAVLDVRESVQQGHNRAIQKRLRRTNWNSGCKSWYLTEDGFNATMYPGFATQYAAQLRTLKPGHYRRVPREAAVAADPRPQRAEAVG